MKPEPRCAIVNLEDAIVKLEGGRLYSGVHRVVSAPGEQGKLPRESVVYFSRPNRDVKSRSLIKRDKKEENVMTAYEWIVYRAIHRNTGNYKGKESVLISRGTEHITKNQEMVA